MGKSGGKWGKFTPKAERKFSPSVLK